MAMKELNIAAGSRNPTLAALQMLHYYTIIKIYMLQMPEIQDQCSVAMAQLWK